MFTGFSRLFLWLRNNKLEDNVGLEQHLRRPIGLDCLLINLSRKMLK